MGFNFVIIKFAGLLHFGMRTFGKNETDAAKKETNKQTYFFLQLSIST